MYKKHPKFSIVLFMLCISYASLGQTDFRPGYIITNVFDTIYGQIDYRGDLRLAKTCVFKKDSKSESISYQPGDIFSFRFEQGKYYVSKIVETENDQKEVFLEFLVNGIANLYYYRDEIDDHYFLEKDPGKLVELTNQVREVYKNGGRYFVESNKYIGILKADFSDCPEIQPDLEKARLSHNSLIKLTSSYHDYVCDDEKCIIYRKEVPAFRVLIAPVIGIGYSTINIQQNSLLEAMNFESSWSPEMGVQFNFLAPRLNEKISILVEAIASKNYHYGYFEEEIGPQTNFYDAHINTSYISSSLGFKYTYPKGLVRPTVALGGQCNILIWSSTHYVEESVFNQTVITNTFPDLPLNELLWGGLAEIGADLHLGQKLIVFCNIRGMTGCGIDTQVLTNMVSLSAIIGIYF
jgi:hypothetical protein